tara:strand:- start:5544 stop:6056 length:513 start_codon:yes stop_codon:yes gene_type:complete
MLHVYDNKLHPNNEKRIDELIQKKKYTSGEKDHPALPPTGQTCELSLEVDEDGIPKEEILQLILQDLKGEQFEKLKSLKLRRAYINKFVPEDKPYFHQDSDAMYTVLYYSSLAYKDLNELGFTEFFYGASINGILPMPGRIVIFKGDIYHRATSCRTLTRHTVALKYNYG